MSCDKCASPSIKRYPIITPKLELNMYCYFCMRETKHEQTSCCGIHYSIEISDEFCEMICPGTHIPPSIFYECKSDSKFCSKNMECCWCEKNIVPKYKSLCSDCLDRGYSKVAEVLTRVKISPQIPPPLIKMITSYFQNDQTLIHQLIKSSKRKLIF